MPKIVISGFYGFDNCGDEAVLFALLHCLRGELPDARFVVLSGNVGKTREVYGVGAVDRWNPFRVFIELLRCDLLISGGGSLLQDVTGSRSCDYYLGVIKMALFLRKKVMIYSQGIGPLILDSNRSAVAKVLERCDVITLRDSASADLLREIGVTRDIRVTCDPVMAVDAENAECLMLNAESGGRPLLAVMVRAWNDNRHYSRVAEFLDGQAKKGWDILFVPAHFPDDNDASKRVAEFMACESSCVDRCLSAHEFLGLTACADRVFSMRLHGLICAMAMGTPFIGLSYDPKVDAFMEQAGLTKFCLSFDEFDSADAMRVMEEMDLALENEAWRVELERRRLEMRMLAMEPAKIAKELIFSG